MQQTMNQCVTQLEVLLSRLSVSSDHVLKLAAAFDGLALSEAVDQRDDILELLTAQIGHLQGLLSEHGYTSLSQMCAEQGDDKMRSLSSRLADRLQAVDRQFQEESKRLHVTHQLVQSVLQAAGLLPQEMTYGQRR